MIDRGELFITEVLRDELEARAKELGVEMPDGFSVDDSHLPNYLHIDNMRPGYKGIAEIFSEGGQFRACGRVHYTLVLNPDYTGDTPYENLVILGDVFVVLEHKV